MRIRMRLNETSTAGSVYSTPSMDSAQQMEPSDEELAIRDTEEKEREKQEAEKEREAAAKKAAENAKKVPKTPAEKGEEGGDDSGGDDEEGDSEDDSDDSDDSGDDEDEDDEGSDDDEEVEDDEESDDEEEEDDDEEATASTLPYPDAVLKKSDVIPPKKEEVKTDPATEEAANLEDNTAANLENTPDDPNVKDGDSKIEATIEAVASSYVSQRNSLPYPDAWK